MYLILLSAPGAGKGTQAKMLAENLGILHVSSGDLFRENIKQGTPLGHEAQEYIEHGELVPDAIVLAMITDYLKHNPSPQGTLLDGFPRNLVQAEELDVALKSSLNSQIDRVIYMKVEPQELASRLSGRWICPTCGTSYHEIKNPPKQSQLCDEDGAALYQRPDDTRATAQNRLQVFFNQTLPLIKYYTDQGVLVEVNGQQSVEAVYADIIKALRNSASNLITSVS